jgi:LmbE family N-acetylglucosaminyl deacetylase
MMFIASKLKEIISLAPVPAGMIDRLIVFFHISRLEKRLEECKLRNIEIIRAEDINSPVVIFPIHPDDASTSAGGLIHAVASRGASTYIILITSGNHYPPDGMSRKEWGELRLVQAQDEARILNAKLIPILARSYEESCYKAGVLADDIKKLYELLNWLQPATVFIPSSIDTHPTHFAYRTLICCTLRLLHWQGEVFEIESPWGLLNPCGLSPRGFNSVFLVNDEDFAAKLQAMRVHRQEMERGKFDIAMKARAEFLSAICSELLTGYGSSSTIKKNYVEVYHRRIVGTS